MNNSTTLFNKVVIGTCSNCGGPVTVHAVWGSVMPDIPTCSECGATKADRYGPVIPMKGSRNEQ